MSVDIKVRASADMRNLEQVRAKNAYAKRMIRKGKGGGDGKAVAKKVPEQIIQNGFLGALAFAIENAGTGYEDVFNAILHHLDDAKVNHGLPCGSLKRFMDELCDKDADVLRAITAEALAFLNYLRRFAETVEGDKKGTEP